MKITMLLMVCVCGFMAPRSATSQATSTQATPGILGYLDPQTGAFRPVHPAAQAIGLPAASPTTGTITLTITITLKTAGLTNISCTANTSVNDAGGSGTFEESNTVAATGSGTTRTCHLKMPYAWTLLDQSVDFMVSSYSVVAGASRTGLLQRTSAVNGFDTRQVPPDGATTILTVAVTI